MKKSFVVDIKIQRSLRVFDDDGPYKIEAHREFDVTDNTGLDEIMDIPIGQLILGSAYRRTASDDNIPTVDLCQG